MKGQILIAMSLMLAIAVRFGSCYICPNPQSYAGRVVCDPWGGYCGQCVSFIKVNTLSRNVTLMVIYALDYTCNVLLLLQRCSNDRRVTQQWRPGVRVRDAKSLPVGTTIATFVNGRYPNAGSMHAAVYVSKDANGILVWDQWVGRPVSRRVIRWNGSGLANNGNSYYVIQ